MPICRGGAPAGGDPLENPGLSLPLSEVSEARPALAREYVDHASGAKNDRPEYRAMLDGARRREFDVLLV